MELTRFQDSVIHSAYVKRFHALLDFEIANAFEEDKRNAYEAGMNWHIAKPIKVDELMSALAKILQ